MRAAIFQVDAFTTRRFAGNPAAVVVLECFPPDDVLQAIAAENNLAETAFVVADGGEFRLRWFTPLVEVPLCGHATLASAAVIIERMDPSRRRIVFQSQSGPLTVERDGDHYLMDFPARPSQAIAPPAGFAEAIGAAPVEVRANSFNYLAVLQDSAAVSALAPDLAAVARLDRPGVIVSAAGEEPYDFISRYFAPAKGIGEDPVTGAAHCMLAPYWAERLGKTTFRAFQASARGGEVGCQLAGERVVLEGACVFYLSGEIEV